MYIEYIPAKMFAEGFEISSPDLMFTNDIGHPLTDTLQHTTLWHMAKLVHTATQFNIQGTRESSAPRPLTHCNPLQHTATHLNTLQYTATHLNTLQYAATHLNTLQYAATHLNTLQYAATHCMQGTRASSAPRRSNLCADGVRSTC